MKTMCQIVRFKKAHMLPTNQSVYIFNSLLLRCPALHSHNYIVTDTLTVVEREAQLIHITHPLFLS